LIHKLLNSHNWQRHIERRILHRRIDYTHIAERPLEQDISHKLQGGQRGNNLSEGRVLRHYSTLKQSRPLGYKPKLDMSSGEGFHYSQALG
jgi:hypothetical protein